MDDLLILLTIASAVLLDSDIWLVRMASRCVLVAIILTL